MLGKIKAEKDIFLRPGDNINLISKIKNEKDINIGVYLERHYKRVLSINSFQHIEKNKNISLTVINISNDIVKLKNGNTIASVYKI